MIFKVPSDLSHSVIVWFFSATIMRSQRRTVIMLLKEIPVELHKGEIIKWVVEMDWSWVENVNIAKKGRKKHNTANGKPCSIQNAQNYMVSKGWYLIRGWSPFSEHGGREPSMWFFVLLQPAEALSLCIFRWWVRLSVCIHNKAWQKNILRDVFVECQLFRTILSAKWEKRVSME